MEVIKNQKTEMWGYYKDWMGTRRQKFKMGFAKKINALEWESAFKLKDGLNINTKFADFVPHKKANFGNYGGQLELYTTKNPFDSFNLRWYIIFSGCAAETCDARSRWSFMRGLHFFNAIK